MAINHQVFNHLVFQLQNSVPVIGWDDMPEHEKKRRLYKRSTTLLHFERLDFDNSYTEEAREELDSAVTRLVVSWRAYRNTHLDRHVVPRSFATRFYRYQMRTYNKHLHKVGFVSVKNRICELHKFVLGPKNTVTGHRERPISGDFPEVLLRCIAMFLLPSAEQHKPYYGYAGKSLGAQIDCTYEPPMIDGKICTKEELYAHNHPVVHADELLVDGWDANSSDDEDWDAELEL